MTKSMFEMRSIEYQEFHAYPWYTNAPSHATARPLSLSTATCPFSLSGRNFDGRLAKVISGLNKFDADLVSKVARAAAAGGGTHIDIACDPDLVRAAKAVSNVPVSMCAAWVTRTR